MIGSRFELVLNSTHTTPSSLTIDDHTPVFTGTVGIIVGSNDAELIDIMAVGSGASKSLTTMLTCCPVVLLTVNRRSFYCCLGSILLNSWFAVLIGICLKGRCNSLG